MRNREEIRKIWGKAGTETKKKKKKSGRRHTTQPQGKKTTSSEGTGREGEVLRVSTTELNITSNNRYLATRALHRDTKGKILHLIRTNYFRSPARNISSQVSILVLSFHLSCHICVLCNTSVKVQPTYKFSNLQPPPCTQQCCKERAMATS